jgi:hypothetical protein
LEEGWSLFSDGNNKFYALRDDQIPKEHLNDEVYFFPLIKNGHGAWVRSEMPFHIGFHCLFPLFGKIG